MSCDFRAFSPRKLSFFSRSPTSTRLVICIALAVTSHRNVTHTRLDVANFPCFFFPLYNIPVVSIHSDISTQIRNSKYHHSSPATVPPHSSSHSSPNHAWATSQLKNHVIRQFISTLLCFQNRRLDMAKPDKYIKKKSEEGQKHIHFWQSACMIISSSSVSPCPFKTD